MKITEFLAIFPDEQSCKLHFKNQRELLGVVCKKCLCTKQYWLESKLQWQCSNCSYRTGLRSGTIMHKTKIDFQTFYLCMTLMSSFKKGISACEMQRQLGHKRYTTVWTLMHRIREAMGQRDDRYKLEGTVELDEAYMAHTLKKNTELKRGRGSQRKQNVVVAAESTPLEDIETGEKSSHFRYAKMKMLNSHEASEINQLVMNNIEKKSDLITDKSTSYEDFSKLFESHNVSKSSKEVTKTTLKWVHITISNAKRNLLGVYHMMNKKHLQSYLNEFCYRLNRRYFGDRLFGRLVIATIYANPSE
ncbi:MAG: IS1595 family transposase [Fluviicola sp.]|jgi:hypothetical protein